MARERRSQLVSVNFDGLTDVVTNLAGTLILLVVLVLGITTAARPRSPVGDSSAEKTDRPIEPLLKQMQLVRLEIQSVDAQVRRMEQGVAELEGRMRALRDQAPAPDPEEDLPDAGAVGAWRPALLAVALVSGTEKGTGPICRDGPKGASHKLDLSPFLPPAVAPPPASRLIGLIEEGIQWGERAISDMEDRMPRLENRIKELLSQAGSIRLPEEKPSRDAEPEPARELRYRPPMEQRTRQSTLLFCCWQGEIRFVDPAALRERFAGDRLAVIDPATLGDGESGDRAGRPGSRFRRRLAVHPPDRWCLNLAVWPDSFEAYRSARAIAWEAGYDVGWTPIESGEPLRVRPGTTSLID